MNRSFCCDRFRGRSNSRNIYSCYNNRDRSSRYSGYNSGLRHSYEITVAEEIQVATEIQHILVVAKDIQIGNRVETKTKKKYSSRDNDLMADLNNDSTGIFTVKAHHIEFQIVRK